MSSSQNSDSISAPQPKKTIQCIGCHAVAQEKFKPFCSVRCQNLDLHQWLTGKYAIPVVEEDGGDGYGDDGY